MPQASHTIPLQASREMGSVCPMNSLLRPACPWLPVVDDGDWLDHSLLRRHGDARDAGFYLDALRYGQFLWRHGHAGRALLAVTRALYAHVPPDDAILRSWPLPYAALAWMLRENDSDDFPGNPRLSYQHQACRLRGERRELRTARAWAVWALACAARPHLPGDPTCPELSLTEIAESLEKEAHPGEAPLWRRALQALDSKP